MAIYNNVNGSIFETNHKYENVNGTIVEVNAKYQNVNGNIYQTYGQMIPLIIGGQLQVSTSEFSRYFGGEYSITQTSRGYTLLSMSGTQAQTTSGVIRTITSHNINKKFKLVGNVVSFINKTLNQNTASSIGRCCNYHSPDSWYGTGQQMVIGSYSGGNYQPAYVDYEGTGETSSRGEFASCSIYPLTTATQKSTITMEIRIYGDLYIQP